MTERVADAPEADELRAIERRRLAALVSGDSETAAALHAEDYELITPGARVYSKAAYLGDIASGDLDYEVFEPASEMRVRIVGDAGITRYRATIKFPDRDAVTVWHTDFYERRDGRWQAVWSHATQVPTD
jgi:hypothetical protein